MPNTATFATTTYGVSYVSVGEADNYFDDQLFPEPWTKSEDSTKEKALVMATKKIDSLMLIGRKVDTEQTLEFPRSLYSDTILNVNRASSSYSQRYNSPCWIDETEVSQSVKDATCEEALALLRGGKQAQQRQQLQRQGVTSFSLGSLSEAYSGAFGSPNKLLSTTAAQLLAKYTGGGRVIS